MSNNEEDKIIRLLSEIEELKKKRQEYCQKEEYKNAGKMQKEG